MPRGKDDQAGQDKEEVEDDKDVPPVILASGQGRLFRLGSKSSRAASTALTCMPVPLMAIRAGRRTSGAVDGARAKVMADALGTAGRMRAKAPTSERIERQTSLP